MSSTVSAPTVDSLFRPVLEAAITLLWNQWADVGGVARRTRDLHSLIDPEVLVLASDALRHREPRLGEVLQPWLRHRADLLSVQRLTNLAGRADTVPRYDPAAIAALALRGPNGHRWKRLAGKAAVDSGSDAVQPMSTSQELRGPNTIMLRLRLGMGVGVKADAMSYLVGSPDWCSVKEVTRATGYTVAAVRRALDELTQAGFISSEEPFAWQSRPARRFRADRSRWQVMLSADHPLPHWGFYRERFDFVVHLSQWLDEGHGQQRWDDLQLGQMGKQWMEQHPLAFRFGAEDRAAFRGRLAAWGEHFRTSLEMLRVWLEG